MLMQRVWWMSVVVAAGSMAAHAREIDYQRDVRPILSDNCYACHGPDAKTRKADLRLDTKAGAFADLGDYAAVVPGKLDDSELYLRIISDDRTEVMPPPKHPKSLTKAQIETLRQWILQGATWTEHWAYQAPKLPARPKGLRHAGWSVNAVDEFILRRLEREGLTPSESADRVTLIRRVTFDLTGLPPTPEEVQAFVNDRSDRAWENVVDRLLASPAYGERMAMYWLDMVRYADSVGYHGDQEISVSPFRDYVIRVFNSNMPFNQFTREQLAGDLLKDPTLWQQVASGYNRLGMMSAEGGVQPKEYLAKYAAERVRNLSTVWMGSTMGCAECHDHKFDPFTTRDFYNMASFFADIKERGIYSGGGRTGRWGPSVQVPTGETKKQIDAVDAQIAELERQMKTPTPELAAAQAKWEVQMRAKLKDGGSTDFNWFEDKKRPNGKADGAWTYVTKQKGPVFSGTFSRRQTGSGIVQHYLLGAKDTIKVEAGSTFFAYVWLDPKNPPKTVMLQFNDGGWEHRVFWGEDRISFGGIGNTKSPGHRHVGPLPETGRWVRLTATPEQVGLKPGSVVNGMAFTQFDGLAYWDRAGINRSGTGLGPAMEKILALDAAKRTPQQREQLSSAFMMRGGVKDARVDKVAALKKQREALEKSIRTTHVTVAVEPRTMRVLPRGNWMDDSGAVVEPAVPAMLPQIEKKDRPNRLDLANWLVDPRNPLTARVFVNRKWKLLFGTGLSKVLDDLGAQGEAPSHPQLLDWLAIEFVQSDWDVKHIMKMLVMSNTYRQSSRVTSELAERDPYNRLLARQSRFRLDAEMVRDNVLAVSDLLVRRIGGRSVKPYQPAGYYAHLNFPRRKYVADKGDDLYRRGIYTHWQRQFLHPMLKAFDAPSREECAVERPRSNTPLAALVLLNDPQFVEAARVFAARAMSDGGGDFDARLRWIFRRALSREALPGEKKLLDGLYRRQLAYYREHAEEAKKLVTTGAFPPAENLDTTELAAWTAVTRAVINMHEFITRN